MDFLEAGRRENALFPPDWQHRYFALLNFFMPMNATFLLVIFGSSAILAGSPLLVGAQTTNTQTNATAQADPGGQENVATNEQQLLTVRTMGINLRDNAGSPIGRVENFVVDSGSGRVEFVLVAPFFPTNSMKILPIPWSAVQHRPDQTGLGGSQIFALNFSRNKLQDAPSFERYRWPDMNQESWRRPIDRFYSVASGQAADGIRERRPQSGVSLGTGAAGTPAGSSAGAGASTTPVYSNDFIGPRVSTQPEVPGRSSPNPLQRREDALGNNSLPVGAPVGARP
jgi:hypothetical protein